MRTSKIFGLLVFVLIASTVLYVSCKSDKPDKPQEVTTKAAPAKIPVFNADRAYNDIAKQLEFGPRVLGSEGHAACQAWLVEQFKATGAKVIEQTFVANVYTGEQFPAANIIAQFNPEISDRLVLAAHWDTRHIADSPLSEERHEEPILGADDGGSGVGVLLEIARLIQENPIGIGIDIVLFDAEDYGQSGGGENSANTYALGSQHWARNPHGPYKARYGILLDMVGAKGAQFPIEGFSYQYARNIVEKVWPLAIRMGKGNYFLKQRSGRITDDHYYVNTIANIPMIDIINLPPNAENGSFGSHWHTHNDDLAIIDKNTLRAVGQVVTAVVYKEDAGEL